MIKSRIPTDEYRTNYDRIFNDDKYVPEKPTGWKEESPEAFHQPPSEETE